MLLLLLLLLGLGVLAARLVQVRRVRYDRVNALQDEYKHLLPDLEKMTYREAEKIVHTSQLYEIPLITVLSLSFALFKTYAIPTISAVLCKSKQLAAPENVGRRAEDTSIVIAEFVNGGGLDSERGATALARMNYLHARYGALITREDKLYTLSAFVFEPALFAERFEWRALTPLEKQARYVFWREVGARMGITDIPATKDALWEWKSAYEVEHFVYADTNKTVGDATMGLFVRPFPAFLRPSAIAAASVFLDDRTRKAFGMPRAPAWMHAVFPALVKFKGLVCRYLLLPRTAPPAYATTEEVVDEKGEKHYRRGGFLWEPWYVAENGSALGLFAFNRPGKQWHPEGFRPQSLGPDRLMGVGEMEVCKAAEEMRAQGMRGCPFF